MKHHKDIDELLHNSPIRRKRRLQTFLLMILVAFALVFAYTRYNNEHAQQVKTQAIQRANQINHLAMLKANAPTEKATATLDQIKALTANYSNN